MLRKAFILSLAVLPTGLYAGSAETIIGASAIVGAAAGVAISGIQASADQNIAAIQADAAMYNTNRTAQNSETLAAMQSQTALGMSIISAMSAAAANQGVTQRLGMQLSEQRAARELQAKLDAMFQSEQYALANRRLDLEEKLADIQAQIRAFTTNGLSNLPTANAGASVEVTRYGIADSDTIGDRLVASASSDGSTALKMNRGLASAPPTSRVEALRGVTSPSLRGPVTQLAALDSSPTPRSVRAVSVASEGDAGGSGHGHHH